MLHFLLGGKKCVRAVCPPCKVHRTLRKTPHVVKHQSHNRLFYAAEYNGCEFVLLEPNEKGSNRYTLTQFSNLSKAVNDVLGKPIAFLFDHRIYHEENLMPNNRGVYFIYSDEYAFLPFLFEDLPYCVRQINTNKSWF